MSTANNLRWREVSPHRQRLMNIYQAYEVVPALPETSQATHSLFRPLFSTSFHLNRHVFPRTPSSSYGSKPIHPLGHIPNVELPWSATDANLESSVVICLGSNSKTARPYTWALLHDRDFSASGPKTLVQVSSHPPPNETKPNSTSASIPVQNISYNDLTSNPEAFLSNLLTAFSPSRIVLIDFGSPYSFASALQTHLETTSALSSVDLVWVMVGTKQPPSSSSSSSSNPDALAVAEKKRDLPRAQFNTSTVRDAVIARDGMDAYAAEINECFARFVRDGNVEEEVQKVGVQPAFGEGGKGIEEGWELLLKGKAEGLMAFRL